MSEDYVRKTRTIPKKKYIKACEFAIRQLNNRISRYLKLRLKKKVRL